jgi:hypothetical protein
MSLESRASASRAAIGQFRRCLWKNCVTMVSAWGSLKPPWPPPRTLYRVAPTLAFSTGFSAPRRDPPLPYAVRSTPLSVRRGCDCMGDDYLTRTSGVSNLRRPTRGHRAAPRQALAQRPRCLRRPIPRSRHYSYNSWQDYCHCQTASTVTAILLHRRPVFGKHISRPRPARSRHPS